MKSRKLLSISFFIILICNASIAQLQDGYTDKHSYNPGDTVKFYTRCELNTGTENHYVTDINANVVGSKVVIKCTQQLGMNTIEPWKNGWGYTETGQWIIPKNIKSGLYYFRNVRRQFNFIVKSNTKADIVVLCPKNTDMAYGRDKHYTNAPDGIGIYMAMDTATKKLVYTPVVSFNRPFEFQENSVGFLKWLYNQQYSCNVIVDYDLEDYKILDSSRILVIVGHSEYWTRNARRNFDQYIKQGNDAVILSGNTMWWQVRYQNDNGNMQMICYKGKYGGYYLNDTIKVDTLETSNYDNPKLNYSITGSIGVEWLLGGYPKDINDGGNIIPYKGFKGYKVTMPNSPIYKNTNVKIGDTIHRIILNNHVNSELDGVKFSEYDPNGIPVFKPADIGCYKAEIIGYDIPNSSNKKPEMRCSPIIVLQKTPTSGKIINTSALHWGRPDHFSNPKVETMTKNMLDLLLNKKNVFTDVIISNSKNIVTKFMDIYPNPSNGSFAVKFNKKQTEYELIIYNSIGQCIERIKVPPYEEGIHLNLKKYYPGIYFVTLTNTNALVAIQKIMIQ